MAKHAIEVSVPVVEPKGGEEEEKEEGEGMEEDRLKGSSSTSDLVPQWAPAPLWVMPVGPGLRLLGQSPPPNHPIWVARQRPPTSSKARGKAQAMQVALLPLETDKELA